MGQGAQAVGHRQLQTIKVRRCQLPSGTDLAGAEPNSNSSCGPTRRTHPTGTAAAGCGAPRAVPPPRLLPAGSQPVGRWRLHGSAPAGCWGWYRLDSALPAGVAGPLPPPLRSLLLHCQTAWCCRPARGWSRRQPPSPAAAPPSAARAAAALPARCGCGGGVGQSWSIEQDARALHATVWLGG